MSSMAASLFIFFFFFFFFLIACMYPSNARLLLSIDKPTTTTGKLHHFSTSPPVEEANEGHEILIGRVTHAPTATEVRDKKINRVNDSKREEKEEENSSGLIPYATKSLVSDSSSYRNRKEHPGLLYSDYSRPRTRPPSHN